MLSTSKVGCPSSAMFEAINIFKYKKKEEWPIVGRVGCVCCGCHGLCVSVGLVCILCISLRVSLRVSLR